jgi:glycosyltransferase involved in cell wall biosynthesis
MKATVLIALVHNILPPYRIPLFNAIAAHTDGRFAVALTRLNYERQRKWQVDISTANFRFKVLRTVGFQTKMRRIFVPWDLGSTLDSWDPTSVVVGGWDQPATWLALRWARSHGIPRLGWLESSPPSVRHTGRVAMSARRRFLAQLDGAIVPGVRASEYLRVLGFNGPIQRMANAAECALPTSPVERSGVVFVGDLSGRKGFDLVLQAAPQLVDRFGRVDIFGDGPLADRAASTANAIPGFRTHGFVENTRVRQFVARAAVTLLPSRADPWPLAAAESIACRTPVVLAPGVGSVPDLVALAGPAVQVIRTESAQELIRCAVLAAGNTVPAASPDALRPDNCAADFVEAVQRAMSR